MKTDVLVIGGGFGGLFAAVKARESGVERVTVVDKGVPRYTAMSNFAAGATLVTLPEDDCDRAFRDMLQGQEGIARAEMVRGIVEESLDRVNDLERYGIEYWRDRHGRYKRMPARGLRYNRFVMFPRDERGSYGGSAVIGALYRRARALGVEFVDRVFITDLLVGGGCIAGAVGIHRRTGEEIEISSRAVVLAAATNSFRGNYACVQAVSGSSYALAYEAGARLANMEFFFTNTGSPRFWLEGTGPAMRLGAKFRNAKGEAFMKKYDPGLADRADAGLLSRGMALEVQAGNGPISFSFGPAGRAISLLPYMNIVRKFGGWMPVHLERLKEEGVDIFRGGHEWLPAHQMHMGGLVTDMDCMSTVPGLFAAGDCQSAGAGGFNGAFTAHCYWSGHHAGTGAARYLAEASGAPRSAARALPGADGGGSRGERMNSGAAINGVRGAGVTRLLGRGGSLTPGEVITRLQRAVFPYEVCILKKEDRLERALGEVLAVREECLGAAAVPDLHQLVKLLEAGNMLLAAEMFLRASLVRKESRKDHYREDYPERDDENWLRWTELEKAGGGMRLSQEHIGIDRSLLEGGV